jgi:hypothetical protein
MKKSPAHKQWHAVCALERPITSIDRLVHMLCYFAEALDDQDQGVALQEVLYIIKGHLELIRETRGQLFHDLHPAPEAGRRVRRRARRRELAMQKKRKRAA